MDLVDTRHDRYFSSIPDLPGVAGVLVSNETDLVFTSNRGEKTVGIFPHGREKTLEKVKVGGLPNGLAFDPAHHYLLAANVAKPEDPSPITVSVVDEKSKTLVADIVVPGRTRWTVFDPKSEKFYVNIAKPAQIIAVNSGDPDGIVASIPIPSLGPHGLDLDPEHGRLFCACDQGELFTVNPDSGALSSPVRLTGPPDVIFYNQQLHHLYVAVGEPGVIDVFDTDKMKLIQTVKTEQGAHTIAYNSVTSKVYSFLPESHKASVYQDE